MVEKTWASKIRLKLPGFSRRLARGSIAIVAGCLLVIILLVHNEKGRDSSWVSSVNVAWRIHPPLIQDGSSVFFVGNSFMGWEGRSLPEWVSALGRSSSPVIRISVDSDIVFGNLPLGNFLIHEKTRQALASRKFKVFVLQGEEFEAVHEKARFHQDVREFVTRVREADAIPVLFMTWEFPWEPFIEDLAQSYEEIAYELKIPVIPVGLIYKDCDLTPYGAQSPYWLTNGELHPNQKGAALNALATLQVLTGIAPSNIGTEVPGVDLDRNEMEYFSRMAWNRVRGRLSLTPVSRSLN